MRNNIKNRITYSEFIKKNKVLLQATGAVFFLLSLLFNVLFFLPIRNGNHYVLGASINISAEELLNQTNKKRQEKGLSPLKISPELTNAANAKTKDMLTYNYWSHNSPSGLTPWTFTKNAGYKYIYAGENLARGYNNTNELINAWMNSPEHRKNMLSPNYKDVGFSIALGTLKGEETVLVVEELGSKKEVTAQKFNNNIFGLR